MCWGKVGKEPWKEQQTDCKRKTDIHIPWDYKHGNIRDTANTLNLEWRERYIFYLEQLSRSSCVQYFISYHLHLNGQPSFNFGLINLWTTWSGLLRSITWIKYSCFWWLFPEPNRAYQILYWMFSTDQLFCEIFMPLCPKCQYVKTHVITHAGTSSSLIHNTWFHIVRTTRLSTIDSRYNHSKKVQGSTKTYKYTKRSVFQ